jgi:hypothetical protein
VTGDARHGRRDNGLTAAHYSAAGDVDPRVGEHLLDVLAVDGIAAYLRPSADINPLTRSSMLPNRPTDRLFVDREHLTTARDYLARLAADAANDTITEALSDDDVFAEIIAGYESEPERPSWPEAEDLTPTPTRAAPPPAVDDDDDDDDSDDGPHDEAAPPAPTADDVQAPTGRARPPVVGSSWGDPAPRTGDRGSAWGLQPYDPESASLLDGLDTFGADLEEEGYTPPAPPPIPRPSLPTALGVIGIIGGLIFFLKPDLLGMDSSVVMMVGFAAVVAGFATLVWRLRPGDDEDGDTDPDHGARV